MKTTQRISKATSGGGYLRGTTKAQECFAEGGIIAVRVYLARIEDDLSYEPFNVFSQGMVHGARDVLVVANIKQERGYENAHRRQPRNDAHRTPPRPRRHSRVRAASVTYNALRSPSSVSREFTMTTNRTSANFRFAPETRALLAALAARLGISQTSVMEMALRKLAIQEKVPIKTHEEKNG